MAYQNGIVPTVGEYILLIIAATVGSMGAAPVPSAAIVMMRECILVFACIEWIWSRKLSEQSRIRSNNSESMMCASLFVHVFG